jgi:uncharacterized LabA/DUF88 family protein
MPLMNQVVNNRNDVMVFIDGGYIRKYTKQKYHTDLINYDTLGRKLAHIVAGVHANLIRIYYYDAMADPKDADKIQNEVERGHVLDTISDRINEQERYFDRINTQEFVTIRQGHLVVANKETPRQKGVDVLMAIDMLTAAYEKQYHWACLVAGDSDFLELVKAVKSTGANVMGFYFKDHAAKALIDSFDRRYDLYSFDFKSNNFI